MRWELSSQLADQVMDELPDAGLKGFDLSGLRTFLTLLYFKFDLLAFGQGLIPVANDCAEMDKHVVAVFTLDEPKAFFLVKPLYSASCRH